MAKRIVTGAGALAAALMIVATTVGSCSETNPNLPDAEAGADARRDSGDGGTVDGGTDGLMPCRPGGAGAPVKEGWLLDDAYDPACGFCFPTDLKYLPPAIEWEACPMTAVPQGMVCQKMKFNWTFSSKEPQSMFADAPTWIMPNGNPLIAIGRVTNEGIVVVIAEADGAVHSAILETNTAMCALGVLGGLRDGHYIYRVYDYEKKGAISEYGGGALGGDIDTLRPRVYKHYHNDNDSRTYYASSFGFVEHQLAGSQFNLYDWSTGTLVTVVDSAPLDDGFLHAALIPTTDALFDEAYKGLAYNKLRVWTPDAGPRDFLTFGSDWTKGVADFGTDGIEMAWAQGEQRDSSSSPFMNLVFYHDKYTLDAATISAKRLTTGYGYFSSAPFVVGCGYAARGTYAHVDAGSSDPLVVGIFRLSDGRRWELPNVKGTGLLWSRPLAITCTDLYALVGVETDGSLVLYDVARVRLDSLGVGFPPD